MNERLPPAEVMGVRLVTPVGLHAAAVKAAIRAGISRARKVTFINKAGERQAIHLLDDEHLEPLSPEISASELAEQHVRMLRLAGPALAEAMSTVTAPLPLFLALPEPLPGTQDPIAPTFVQDLAIQARVKLDAKRSAIYREGAGFLFALRDALHFLANSHGSQVVVGGVDSFWDSIRLNILDAEDRLYGFQSRLGFQPGEGAGFILLRGKNQSRQPAAGRALARVIGVGVGKEKGHRYSEEPYRGDGLAEAFADLFDPLPPDFPKVRCVYCGFNGENMPAKEWGASLIRNTGRFVYDTQIEHPADCIGDAGAALGAIMLGLAALAINEGHQPEPRPIWAREDPGPCLVWSTSDREPRAAALVQWE